MKALARASAFSIPRKERDAHEYVHGSVPIVGQAEDAKHGYQSAYCTKAKSKNYIQRRISKNFPTKLVVEVRFFPNYL